MKTATQALVLAVLLSPALQAADTDLDALYRNCESCHGSDGVSVDSDVPTIAGQPEPLIANAHERFKDWARPCSDHEQGEHGTLTSMCAVSETLDTPTINAIARHYSALDFRPAKQWFDNDLAVEGARIHQTYCESCHPGGGSKPGYAGRLAGQWTPYLRATIRQLDRQEALVPRIMAHKLSQFSPEDIEALLSFWASQQE